jgi:hypothetical protein
LTDSSVKQRPPDNPGVEAGAFDSGYRYLCGESLR